MSTERKEPLELTVQRMDKELISKGARISLEKLFDFPDSEGSYARDCIMRGVRKLYAGASPPQNEEMASMDIYELARALICKTGQIEENRNRGIWYEDGRMDYYGITDSRVRRNAGCVAAVTLQNNLIDLGNGYSQLKARSYKKVFNLWQNESFGEQPVSIGPLCTGFLAAKNIVVSAAHFTDHYRLEELRIVFGFKMVSPTGTDIKISNDNIYRVEKLIYSVHNRQHLGGDGCDYAVLKLDRDVAGREVVRMSGKPVKKTQEVYVIGHPVGLPLKYGPGAWVLDSHSAYFSANLDVYMGNSGSPVFDKETHEVVGMVVRGDTRDFRWTGKGWASVIYPNREYSTCAPPQCTKVSKFDRFCK